MNGTRLKSYLASLTGRERIGLAARVLSVLFCLILQIVMADEFGSDERELCITVPVLIGAAFFCGPFLFSLLYVPVFLMLLTDTHLYRAYGLSLFSVGEQISAVILDANKAEIFEYICKIGLFELTALFLLVPTLVCLFFFKPKLTGIEKTWRTAVISTVLLCYPFGYVSHLYPAVLSKFAKETTKRLAEAEAFRFRPDGTGTKADTVVVLIGESHRYPEFMHAFDKHANRFQNLYPFSDMISQYANTLATVPTILSRKKANDPYAFFNEKSLFALFKEAGYATYFVHYVSTSSEMNDLSFIYRQADRFIRYEKNVSETTDEKIRPVLDRILAEPQKKKLIVIKMIGVHIAFDRRYPDPEKTMLRNLFSMFGKRTKEKELYHYGKAVSYSAGIVADIMTTVDRRPEPAMLFFSSDHGFCIFDKGHFHLPANCRNAFHIPAMFLLNPALSAITDEETKQKLLCNADKALTQDYDFETVASLAGIRYPSANAAYDLTKTCDPLAGKKRRVNTAARIVAYEDI